MAVSPPIQRVRPTTRPPAWLLKAGKWPALLVRLGAGRLIGDGMAIITHTGRRSRRLFQTAVQVLDEDPSSGEIYVVAWSRDADWFKNVQASPAVEVWHSGRRYRPQQRLLTESEIASKLLVHFETRRFQNRIGWRGIQTFSLSVCL